MKLFYQGEPGAYSHVVASWAAPFFGADESETEGLKTFADVWKAVENGGIGILPIENSYAGSIHDNLYGFLRYPFVTLAEYALPVSHCLLSHETEISAIKKAYSHPQALAQCYGFLKANAIESVVHADTAGAAKELSRTREPGAASVSSSKAGGIYGLNVLAEGIQDQQGNTTRFFVVARPDMAKSAVSEFPKTGKTSIVFEVKNVPAALYKCLGAFATHGVNLTKIESLPSLGDPFSYVFWIDFEDGAETEGAKGALAELEFFAKEVRILGNY